MWVTHAKAMARKEIGESCRRGWRPALFVLATAPFINWLTVRLYVVTGVADPLGLRVAASMPMIYVGMIVIPFLANTHLIRSLVEERHRQSILSLLATGVSPHVVWLTKLAVAFVTGYAVMLVSLVLHVLVVVLYWHVVPVFTAEIVTGTLFVCPLLALMFIALVAFAYWYFRHAETVAGILPMTAAMAFWWYGTYSPGGNLLRSITILATVGPPVVIAVGALLISRMSKQRIAGL